MNTTTASVYLGGYAVECVLKALILASEPQVRHRQTVESFLGGHGHNFDWLQGQLRQRRIVLSGTIQMALTGVSEWTTDLRYDPIVYKQQDAKIFLTAAEEMIRWVQGKL